VYPITGWVKPKKIVGEVSIRVGSEVIGACQTDCYLRSPMPQLRRGRGDRPRVEEYVERFPENADAIRAAFAETPAEREDLSARRALPDTGRNLLFGVLALQNNFISRDDLLGAFAAWVADKKHPLAQILVDRRALDAGRRALLEALKVGWDEFMSLRMKSLAARSRSRRSCPIRTPRISAAGSSSRPRSMVDWSTQGSCPFTAWAPMLTDGRSMPCASSRATA
jgi:hypothetical protein